MKKPFKVKKLYRRMTCCAAVIVMIFAACSMRTAIPTKQYYIITYTPSATVHATSQRPYPYALHVGRFEVQRIFNRQNIIYRYSPNQIEYYELERWAVRPADMIKDMVFKHLEASRLTNLVSVEFLDRKPDYRIEGLVEALEKFDSGDIFFAHLAMTLKMIRISDGEQIWNYSFDQRRQVYSIEMVHTVRGLSSILQSQMNFAISQLDSLFLSLETGTPVVTEDKGIPTPLSPADSTGIDEAGLDESTFEIIPEKK